MGSCNNMRFSAQTGRTTDPTLDVGANSMESDRRMTTRAASELPALDEKAIAELERGLPGGNLDGALEIFADELDKRDAEIRDALAATDHGALASIAHGLKGSAATFCAPALARAAQLLEEKLPDQNAEQIGLASIALAAEAGRAVGCVREFLARRSGTHG